MITIQPPLLPPDSPLLFATTFEEYLATLPDWDRTLFDGLILVESCYGILDRLRQALECADDEGVNPILGLHPRLGLKLRT